MEVWIITIGDIDKTPIIFGKTCIFYQLLVVASQIIIANIMQMITGMQDFIEGVVKGG